MAEDVRLQKWLAQAGVASRRKCEELIAAGRVRVNQQVVTTLGTKMTPGKDRVYLDNQEVLPPNQLAYLMLHKPVGYLVSRGDPHQRNTIYELLPPQWHHLHPVGRLDQDSSGLLLMTNDGEMTQQLIKPGRKLWKHYRVTVSGNLTSEHLHALNYGIKLEDGKTLPAKVRLVGVQKHTLVLDFQLQEGRNRQIRRMCLACHLKVLALHRYQVGSLLMKDLKPGAFRPLTNQERKGLLNDIVTTKQKG